GGPFRTGARPNVEGGYPSNGGGDLVLPLRTRPDVAPARGAARGRGRSPRRVPHDPSRYAFPVSLPRGGAARRDRSDDAAVAGRGRGDRRPRCVEPGGTLIVAVLFKNIHSTNP